MDCRTCGKRADFREKRENYFGQKFYFYFCFEHSDSKMERLDLTPLMDPLDVLMCNCSQCGREMLGAGNRDIQRRTGTALPYEVRDMEWVYCRMDGRPWCRWCAGGRWVLGAA